MNMLLNAEHILSLDKRLALVLEHVPIVLPKTNDDVYFVLLKSIVEQQLSVKSAAAIWMRFLALYEANPSSDLILNTHSDALRSVGLSYRKAQYLKNIALFSQENDLSKSFLEELDDDQAIAHLTQIKGVGKWTAEMILMFALGRANVFPVDDLVIRNAMIRLYGLSSEKKALIIDMNSIAELWTPFRSYASYALWDWYEGKHPPHIN
tara:strand:+ start:1174 stop:1797 length:624 start_codon:yes stop_codon:yes gene_type:complete